MFYARMALYFAVVSAFYSRVALHFAVVSARQNTLPTLTNRGEGLRIAMHLGTLRGLGGGPAAYEILTRFVEMPKRVPPTLDGRVGIFQYEPDTRDPDELGSRASNRERPKP